MVDTQSLVADYLSRGGKITVGTVGRTARQQRSDARHIEARRLALRLVEGEHIVRSMASDVHVWRYARAAAVEMIAEEKGSMLATGERMRTAHSWFKDCQRRIVETFGGKSPYALNAKGKPMGFITQKAPA